MKRRIGLYALAAIGLGMMAAAVLATRLGLDHNTAWGPGRILLFCAGAAMLATSWLFSSRSTLGRMLRSRLGAAFQALGQIQPSPSARQKWVRGLAGSVVVLIVAAYVFLGSAGTWSTWPEMSRYYDDLARAFLRGHVYLDVEPSAALRAVADPYDATARKQDPELKTFVDEVYDLSYYRGKFYVYWGPVPALLVSAVRSFSAHPIGDHILTFAFLVGVLFFTVLIILEVWRGLYAEVPFLLALVGMTAAGLAHPIPAMLSNAAIYEATIAAGQFFLVGGLYFAVTGQKAPAGSRSKLIVAAALWALAAASRTLLVVPVVALTTILMIRAATAGERAKPILKKMAAASVHAVPLALVVLALGWYNWSRFGSPLETGYRYVLSFDNLSTEDSQSFSLAYAAPNVWMYLLNPFETQPRFPFVAATFFVNPLFQYAGEAGRYHLEASTGLLWAVPFTVFSLAAAANLGSLALSWNRRRGRARDDDGRRWQLWTLIVLGAALVPAAGVVLLYYDVRMRYLAEFLPSLMLLSVLGAFQGYRWLQRRPVIRRLYTLVAVCVALASVGTSLLLALAENYGRFRHYSPQLMKQLVVFFAP